MNNNNLKPSPFKTVKASGNKIGIGSRVKFNINIVKSDGDSFILGPFAKTSKEFNQEDIKSVEGVALTEALNKGYIQIIR